MAPRSNWKGYLKLSLVSCPVQLFPATTTKEKVAFHLLHRETGNRLKRKLIDPDTDETVEAEDQVRGYQVSKTEYVLVEDEEIESVAIESSHTIDIETFVPRSEIDEAYLDTPYYLAPDGKLGEEAFGVIREAMRDKQVVGIGRVVLYRRERPILLEPRGNGLVATTLRYAYEVRDDADYFGDIEDAPVADEMLDLATHIISKKMAHFDPKRFEDRYQDALLELIKAKQHHQPVSAAKPAQKSGNVVSLMDALRRSIAADPASTKDTSQEESAKPERAKAAKAGADDKAAAKPKPAESKPAAKPHSTARREPAAKAARAPRLKKAG